jgi:hypothetical protein
VFCLSTHRRFSFLLFFLFIILVKNLNAELNQFKLTTELNNFQDCILRGILNLNSVKAFLLVKNYELSSFGFSTPFSVVGPLILTGILREIRNPLAYKATSSVFYENTDLTLTTSLGGSSYWGVAFKPLPQNIVLYYLGQREKPFSLGAVLKLDWDRFLHIESLFSTCSPSASSLLRSEESDIWFDDKPVFAGGRILHLASRVRLEGENIFGIVSGSYSYGSLVLPGYFLHLVSGYNARIFKCSFIYGFANGDYVNPLGAYNSKNITYGGDFSLSLFPWLTWKEEYQQTIENRKPQGTNYTESKEVVSSILELVISLGGTSSLYLNGEHRMSFYFTPGEDDYINHDLKYTATLEIDKQKITSELYFYAVGLEDLNTALALKLELTIAIINIMLKLKLYDADQERSFFGAFSININVINHKFYLELSTPKQLSFNNFDWQKISNNPVRFFSLTLGWEVIW